MDGMQSGKVPVGYKAMLCKEWITESFQPELRAGAGKVTEGTRGATTQVSGFHTS